MSGRERQEGIYNGSWTVLKESKWESELQEPRGAHAFFLSLCDSDFFQLLNYPNDLISITSTPKLVKYCGESGLRGDRKGCVARERFAPSKVNIDGLETEEESNRQTALIVPDHGKQEMMKKV
ncbi:unnamed protein product [Dovyalis caffra]|uniref:Uncharacterized protein n=1 Tax=Dovyalis caffra TaxID=77055 RepID=A0AAV1SK71_9ROSI|nr:unnamed protein product [Dovyalis caffra]